MVETAGSRDLIVVGAGTAGAAAARRCASEGWSVAIVDELPYGGTCALRGCDPKKILRRGAEIIDSARLMTGKGIDPAGLSINWADLMQQKRGFTDPAPGNLESDLASVGVETLHGRAEFTDTNDIDIDGTAYRADRFLIATGARPRPLDFDGAELLTDSTGFLNLDELPRLVVFVGGGFISFEFAHIAARAGAAATIIEHGDRPLESFDPDLVDLLVARSEQVGITVRSRTSVVAVETTSGGGYAVTVETDGRTETIMADLVVHGAGRIADLSHLGLDAAGVEHDDSGVAVHPHLQSTTNPSVFAAGDSASTPGPPLTPVAVFEAKVAAANMISGTTTAPDHSAVPTTVFTVPELARVGMLESEARAHDIDLEVHYNDTSGWYSNYRIGETTAAAKVLVDKRTDLVVGAHLLGPGYSELINTFALAMKTGLTTKQLRSVTAIYPSIGSDLASML